MQFTDEQALQIYHQLTTMDDRLIAQLARAAIQNALEIQVDMVQDQQVKDVNPDRPFDENDVRNLAINHTRDTLKDATELLIELITAAQFQTGARAKLTVQTNLTFK